MSSGFSLSGGRGSAFAALLGIVVIQSVHLLRPDPAQPGLTVTLAVTDAVLLLAVILDSVVLNSRKRTGRA